MLQNKPEDKKPEEPKFRVPIGPAVGGKEAVATIAAQFPIFPSNNPNIIVQKPANAPSAKVIYINAPTQPGAAIAIAQNTTGPELKDNSEEIVGAAIIGSLPNDPQAINTKGTLSLGSIKVPEVPFGSAVLMFDLKQGQTINTSMIKSASFVTEEGSLGGNMVTAAKDMRIAVIIPRGDHGMLQDRDPKGKTLNPNPKTALPAGKLQVYDLQVALDTYNSRLTAIKNEHERKMLSQTPTTQEDKMKDYNSLLDLYDELRTKQKEAQTVKLTPNDVSKLRDLNAKTNSAVNPYIKAMEHGKQAMSDYKSQKKNTQWTEVQGVLAYITSRHNGAEGKRPPGGMKNCRVLQGTNVITTWWFWNYCRHFSETC